MKPRALWLIVFLAALAISAVYFFREPPARSLPLERMSREIPQPAPPPLPPVQLPPLPERLPGIVMATPAINALTSVPIEDGKTIDFSKGFPLVKDSATEKAIIERATKEMAEGMKGVSFTSPAAPAAPATPPPEKK